MWVSRHIGESSRDVAKDMLKDSLKTSASSIFSPDAIYPGQIRNLVKSDRSKYNKIRKSSRSTLTKLLYCQSGLSNAITNALTGTSSLSSSTSTAGRWINPKSIINHEFLVIVMRIRGSSYMFLAEKCGAGGSCGIVIKPVTDPEEMKVLQEAEVSTFDCEDTPMNLEEMLGILEDHDPDYSANEKNCWEYAVGTSQRLLMACRRITGKKEFEEQAKLVGATVTVNHVKEMTSRGLQVLLNVLTG